MSLFEQYINRKLPIKEELLGMFDINEPLVIFDIGACEGEDSIRYYRLFNNSSIFAFEPLPENFQLCIQNFSLIQTDRLKAFQVALSDKPGISKFYVSSGRPSGLENSDWDYGNKSSSLYPPDLVCKKYDWLKFDKEILVRTQTIERFCNDQFVDHIDFIHLDVQGAELDVLKGCGQILSNVKAIWVEVENISIYKGQPLKKDIEKFMKISGFFKITDTTIWNDYGDILYINSKYFSRSSIFALKARIRSKLKLIYSKI